MQDRLKTRVYEPDTGIMHYTDFVLTCTGYVAKLKPVYTVDYVDVYGETIEEQSENEFLIDQTDLDTDKSVIVMQCTGRRSELKQLVYESDIVDTWKFSTGQRKRQVVVFDKKRCGCRLVDIEEFNKGNLNSPQSMANITSIIRVLGNIHEHPELLEGGCDV